MQYRKDEQKRSLTTQEIRSKRQKEAIERQRKYDAMSDEEKLAELDRVCIAAKKERKRIEERIAKKA